MALLPRPSSSAGFFRACRLGILLFIFVVLATLLQHLSVSASELHHNSATVSGTPHVHYYLRGKLIAVAAAAQQDFVGHEGRNLKEEMSSSFDAESVELSDYSPCANNKHDPSFASALERIHWSATSSHPHTPSLGTFPSKLAKPTLSFLF